MGNDPYKLSFQVATFSVRDVGSILDLKSQFTGKTGTIILSFFTYLEPNVRWIYNAR